MWRRGTQFVKDVVARLHAYVCLSPWIAAYVLDRLLGEGSLGKYLSIESAHTPRGKRNRDTVLLRMECDLDAWLVQLAEPYEAWLVEKCGGYGDLYISAFPPWARRLSWPDRSWGGSVCEPEPSSMIGTVWFVAFLLDTIAESAGTAPSPDGVQVKTKRKNKVWRPKAIACVLRAHPEVPTATEVARVVGVWPSTVTNDKVMQALLSRRASRAQLMDPVMLDAVASDPKAKSVLDLLIEKERASGAMP